MRENKNYELRSTTKPGLSPLLSTTVAITANGGKRYYCYVSFSDKLVTAVGKKLPHGLHISNPAHLHVTELTNVRTSLRYWNVYAVTLTGLGVYLWSQAEMPAWLKLISVRKAKKS